MSWELKNVSSLCDLAIDCVNKTAPVVDYETPFKMIRTTNVKSGFIDYKNVRFVEEATFNKWTRRSKPEYGDVIFTREAPVGDVGRFTSKDKNFFLGQRLFHYRPNPELLDWQYLAYILQSDAIQGWVHGIAFGATVPHIKVEDAENLKIPCPPIHIQKKIGNILSAYDDLIENNLKRIKLLEEMAQITYEQWFVRMKFPGHETIPVDGETGLPKGWVSMALNKALNVNPSTKITNKKAKSPFVPMGSLSTDSMVIDGIEQRIPSGGAKFINGDTLVARITPCLENGKTGFVNFLKDEQVATGSTEFIVLRETINVNRYFIYCLSRSEYFRELSIRSMAGSDGRQRVNPKIYNKMLLLIPPREVMVCFGDKAKPIFDLVYFLVKQNTVLKEARDILLPRLMTGMINVDHIELPIAKEGTEAA